MHALYKQEHPEKHTRHMSLEEMHCSHLPIVIPMLGCLTKTLTYSCYCHTSQSSQLSRLEMMLKNRGNSFDYRQSQSTLHMVKLLSRNRHSSILASISQGAPTNIENNNWQPLALDTLLGSTPVGPQVERRAGTQWIAPVQIDSYANQTGS